MGQLIIENLTKSVGDKTLFKDVAFTIKKGEKVGLIGINGTGKSTLLSIIAGLEDADSLSKEHPNSYRITYLPQDLQLDPELTVLETVFQSDAPLIRLNYEYEQAVAAIAKDPESAETADRFNRVSAEMDARAGYDLNTKARTVLSRLGIETFEKKIGSLSGGQQKRVALAKVLIEPADLLLLDEPTNHLDIQSITWLQDYLSMETGAVLFITHDRYFLDAVATHIYELADRTLYSHTGNFADYLESKAIREEIALSTASKMKNRYRTELQWIRRGAKARSTKQKARIGRFEELKEAVSKKESDQDLDLSLQTSRLGRKVIECSDVSKSYDGRPIITSFNCLLLSNDRIAIVGPNGAGKTTLMKLIAGEVKPDSGTVDTGQTVKIAHFSQQLPDMPENMRMIEYIRDISNDIEDSEGNRVSATQMLERFLFPSSVHGTQIGKLSGGEKKRLYLLSLLMEQPNVLLLDEPTNDLDIETLSVLESFMDTFPGVVLTISHDRFFLDRTSSKLWIVDGSGSVETYYGMYTEYLAEKETVPAKNSSASKPAEEDKEVKLEDAVTKKRMSYKERKEWETIDADIEKIEDRISAVEQEMIDRGADYDALRELTITQQELNEEYERLIERWSYLSDINEQN